MQSLPYILLKSFITVGLMLAYYVLILRNKKLYQFNRWYLILTVAAGLTIPFFHFDIYSVAEESAATTIQVLDDVSSVSTEEIHIGDRGSSYVLGHIFWVLYSAVSLMLLIQTFRKIAWVYKMKATHKVTKLEGYNLIHTNLSKAPFSFMNNLFWNEGIDINSETGKQVLKHELTHITQQHTIDKLFMQIVVIVCWINPLFRYIQRELSMIHEFLADDNAIENNSTESFAKMLIASHYKTALPTIINPFYSPTKRRIIMFKKNNKTRYAMLRKAAVLPLLLVPVFMFSFTISESKVIHNTNHKMTLILDAGHGGTDEGANNENGIIEKDVNLKICRTIARLAADYNINVVQTRPDDEYPTLAERVARANEINNGVFVSVHLNKSSPEVITASGMRAYENKAYNGFEVFIVGKSEHYEESKILASSILQQLHSAGHQTGLTERGLIVLRNNNHPAVLIECGNIDNPNDMAILNDDRQLKAVCNEILSGIVTYTNSLETGK